MGQVPEIKLMMMMIIIIAFLPKVVLLLNLNNAKQHILFTFLTLNMTFYPIVSFSSCLQ